MGQTVWGGGWRDADAGLAWDWVLIANGVVAMADPMCVVSNLRLLGRDGEVLTAYEAAVHLSQIICALPWQDEVFRVLQAA